MSDWQPIETAPKDGTFVDLWAGGRRWTDCRFGPVDYKLVPGWGRDGGNAHEHGYSGKTVDEVKDPTHWMQIPAPPA